MKKIFMSAAVIPGVDKAFSLMLTYPSGEVKTVNSLTADRAFAEYICERINTGDVSEDHIYDVVEDLLP